MAVGTPVQDSTAIKLSQAGSSTISPTSTITVSTFCLLVVTNGASKTVSSVSDNAGGNTWVVDHTHVGNTKTISYISCRLATQITSSTVITITYSASTTGDAVYWLVTIPNIASSSQFDKSADQDLTGTSISCGPTATLSMADEIVFCAGRGSVTAGNSFTAGSGYTGAAAFTEYPTSGGPSQLEYKIVAATTAVTGTGTWGQSQTGTHSVATYKGITANPPVNTVAPVASGTAAIGQTLSTTDGTWTGDATITFTYQWQSGGADIGGATGNTHVVQFGEAGTNVTCNVKGTNAAGNATATSNAIAIPAIVTLASTPAGTTTLAADTVETLTFTGAPAGTAALAADTVETRVLNAAPAGTATIAAPAVTALSVAAAITDAATLAVDLNNQAATFATPIPAPEVGALVGVTL